MSNLVETKGLREVDTQTALALTTLGSDDDSTVQTARTVKGGSGSTFQH